MCSGPMIHLKPNVNIDTVQGEDMKQRHEIEEWLGAGASASLIQQYLFGKKHRIKTFKYN